MTGDLAFQNSASVTLFALFNLTFTLLFFLYLLFLTFSTSLRSRDSSRAIVLPRISFTNLDRIDCNVQPYLVMFHPTIQQPEVEEVEMVDASPLANESQTGTQQSTYGRVETSALFNTRPAFSTLAPTAEPFIPNFHLFDTSTLDQHTSIYEPVDVNNPSELYSKLSPVAKPWCPDWIEGSILPPPKQKPKSTPLAIPMISLSPGQRYKFSPNTKAANVLSPASQRFVDLYAPPVKPTTTQRPGLLKQNRPSLYNEAKTNGLSSSKTQGVQKNNKSNTDGLLPNKTFGVQNTYHSNTNSLFSNQTQGLQNQYQSEINGCFLNKKQGLQIDQSLNIGRQNRMTSCGSSSSSFDTQRSTDDCNANSFESLTSVSTAQSCISRKRSIDEGVQIAEPQPNLRKGSFAKYRRLSADGVGVAVENGEPAITPQSQAVEVRGCLGSLPLSTFFPDSPSPSRGSSSNNMNNSNHMGNVDANNMNNMGTPNNMGIAKSMGTPDSTMDAMDIDAMDTDAMVIDTVDIVGPATPVRQDLGIQKQCSTPNNQIPGCWPATPGATPHSAGTLHPGLDVTRQVEGAMISGALLAPEAQTSPNIVSEYTGQTLRIGHRRQMAIAWANYTAPLYGAVRGVCALKRGVTQVVGGAWAYAGTAAQRAIAAIGRRHRAAPRRAATGPHSPVHVNIRNITPEQQRRFRENQRLRDRGIVPEEERPFPELFIESSPLSALPSPPSSPASSESPPASPTAKLSFDSSPISPSPQLTSEHDVSTHLNRDCRSTTTPTRGTRKHSAISPKFQTRRVSEAKPRALKPSTSGIRKMSRVAPVSPQLKSHMLGGYQARLQGYDRQRARERALHVLGVNRALRAGDIATLRRISEQYARIRSPTPGQADGSKYTSRLSKKKRRVHFSEPLVTGAASPLVLELAPHLHPSPKIELIEQKENIPPQTVVEPSPAAEAAVDEAQATVDEVIESDEETWVDPWSQPADPLLGRPLSAVSLCYPVAKPIPEGRTESLYADEWRTMEEKEKSEKREGRKRLEGAAVRPLPPKWETRVEEAMRLPNNRKVATTLSGDPLTKKDLATCFTPLQWLNDEVINSYLALIVDYLRRDKNNAGRHDMPKYHAFNSFFFSNLRDKGYESVRRWGSRAKIGGDNLLKVDTVFVPVHNNSHWTLILVKPIEKTIEHFDSLGSLSRRHVEIVKTWLHGELGSKYVEDEWKVLPSQSPQQDNGSDCGVFLLSTAKAVALDIEPLCYGPRDTRLLRKKIVAELMNGGLEGDFHPGAGDEARM
ncbi:hypothetical protein BDV12DRAFT_175281 [Aspergillus spectabilis]